MDLILSIASATCILLVFKLIPRFGANTLHAITANYAVATVLGLILLPDKSQLLEQGLDSWVWAGLAVGCLFTGVFFVMAKTSQHIGVGTAGVASKLSLVFSAAMLAILNPEHPLGIGHYLTLGLAMAGVYLSSMNRAEEKIPSSLLILPLLVFTGSGLIDVVLVYHSNYVLESGFQRGLFICLPFLSAFACGATISMLKARKGREQVKRISILLGLLLGLANFGSVFFLLRIFDSGYLSKTAVIPANNLGIILAGTAMGVMFFKESLTRQRIVGLALSLAAMVLLLFLG
jgi:drug/metabolite transporter (DMT)-like permease